MRGSHPKRRDHEFAALYQLACGDLQLRRGFGRIACDEAGTQQCQAEDGFFHKHAQGLDRFKRVNHRLPIQEKGPA